MRRFGYAPDRADAANAAGDIRSAFEPVLQAASDALNRGDAEQSHAQATFLALRQISGSAVIQSMVSGSNNFGSEIFDYLVHEYISTRLGSVAPVLSALGVFDIRRVNTTDADGRSVDYDRVTMRWDRLGTFLQDNAAWARDVYGWGATPDVDGRMFDHELAMARVAGVLESMQLAFSRLEALPDAEADKFLVNRAGASVSQLITLIYQDTFERIAVTADPIYSNEVGLKVLPSGDLNQPASLGLAIAPFARGNLATEIDLSDSLSLRLDATAAAAVGAYLRLSPNGLEVIRGGAVDVSFEMGFRYAKADGTPMIPLGEPGATRVEMAAVLGSVGGNMDGDLFVAGGIQGLKAVIDVSGDGFLGAVVPKPIEILAGDVLMGWRTGRGVYFEGGTSLSITVPLDLKVGSLSIYEFGLLLDWEDGVSVTGLITGDATLGPVFAYVEDAGIEVRLVPAPAGDGLLGNHNLDFHFVPPTGYAVALNLPAIEGGGFLSVDDQEYRGALALNFGSIGFAAFGILNTQLPGGSRGFSLAASIFGEFTLPLGYGFFLTGIGGVIGINRTINTDALRAVLYEGRLDSILFPSNPIANARTILQDMAEILPAREGQHLFGPVARISWGQPNLVDVKLGLVLEVGAEIRILILGRLGSDLPTRDTALVSLGMSFFGEIDFAAGSISFDATLEGSRVLTFAISGDAAIRTGWKPNIPTVAAFGGLHPQYPRPSNLPELRRLSINFGTNNPKITLSAYQAITLNSLQFGAAASIYAKGPKVWLIGSLAVEGECAFDALVYFNPFTFGAELGGSLSLLVDGNVVAGLGFSLRLTGPNTFVINGKVWVTLLGQDIDFPIRHTWGNRQSLPVATADAVAELRRTLTADSVLDPVATRGRSVGVTFRDADDVKTAVDPIGGLRYVQRALPLGVKIEKIGEALLSKPKSLDIKVYRDGVLANVAPANEQFVRGHFVALNDAERLRSPAFETHKAGFELGAEALIVRSEDAIEAEHDYEVILIPSIDDRQAPFSVSAHGELSRDFAARFMAVTHEMRARPPVSLKDRFVPVDPVILTETEFIQQAETSRIEAENTVDVSTFRRIMPTHRSLTSAVSVAARYRDSNLAVRDYVAAARFER